MIGQIKGIIVSKLAPDVLVDVQGIVTRFWSLWVPFLIFQKSAKVALFIHILLFVMMPNCYLDSPHYRREHYFGA